MESIENCKNSKLSLREREEIFLDAINELDLESLRLYRRVKDKNSISQEEWNSLYQEIINLQGLFAKLVDVSDYLDEVEISSYSFAYRRLRMKTTLTLIASFYASTIFPPLGFISFVGLYPQVKNYFVDEITEIEDLMRIHSVEDQFTLIQRTLEKCSKGCMNKWDQVELDAERKLQLKANNCLLVLLTAGIPEDEIKYIPREVREKVIEMIQENKIDSLMDAISYLQAPEKGNEYQKRTNES